MLEMAYALGFERWAQFHHAEKRKKGVSYRGRSWGSFSMFGATCIVSQAEV